MNKKQTIQVVVAAVAIVASIVLFVWNRSQQNSTYSSPLEDIPENIREDFSPELLERINEGQ